MLVPGLLPGLVPPLGAPPPEGAPPPVPCAAAKAVKRTRRIATCRMRCTACMWDLAFAPQQKQSALFKRGTPPSGARRAGPDKRDYTAPAATRCRARMSKRCNVQTSSYTGRHIFPHCPFVTFDPNCRRLASIEYGPTCRSLASPESRACGRSPRPLAGALPSSLSSRCMRVMRHR